jgi:plastocyanin
MRKLLFAVAGTMALGLAVMGTAVAHGPGPVHSPTGRVIKMQGQANALTINHIVQGCHNWTNGTMLSEKAVVTMRPGGKVTIRNLDVDAHKVVQLAGAKIATGARMVMNGTVTLRFAKSGTYRFKTVTSELMNMPMMKTIGADYRLLLTVRVK